MKKLLITAALFTSLQSFAQSDSIAIKMDTMTYKYIVLLIRENIDGRTATGQTIIGNILTPLSRYEFIATKPKEITKIKK